MIAAADLGPVGRDLTGTVIQDAIEIQDKVGEGGMGSVYRAFHRGWNQTMAVKVPRDDLFTDYVDRERWLLEAHTWIDLGLHPNIVSCFFIHQWEGIPLLFLDYLPGGSLKDLIRSGTLKQGDWPRLIEMAIQVCDGLAYAHNLGLVHRDIKPANLLMDEEGQVHVTDFGLVKVKNVEVANPNPRGDGRPAHYSDNLGITTTGTVVGTPQYAAPEQWLNEPNIGMAADIYALGVVLFELCVGRLPFEPPAGPTAITQLLIGHLHTPPPVPNKLVPEMPYELSDLILQCLAKAPEDRPPSALFIRRRLAELYSEITHQAALPAPQAAAQRADALNNKAVSLWSLGKHGEAFVAWAEALKLDPLHPESVYNRSLVQWMEGQLDPIEVIRRLRQVRATYQRAALYLGYFLLIRGNASDAETYLKEALDLPEVRDDSRAWKALGDALMSSRQLTSAQAAYTQSLQISPRQQEVERRLELAGGKGDISYLFPSSKPLMETRLDKRIQALAFGGQSLVALRSGQLMSLEIRTGRVRWASEELYDFTQCTVLGERDLIIGMDCASSPFVRLSTGELLHRLPEGQRCLAVHPNRQQALVGLVDLWVIDLNTFKPLYRLLGHEKQVQVARFSASGKFLFTGACDRTARLWNTETAACVKEFSRHKDFVDAVAISHDGTLGLSGGRDKAVRAWNLQSGECYQHWTDLPGEVRNIDISLDKRWTVISTFHAGQDVSTIWDMLRGTQVKKMEGKATLSRDGFHLLLPKLNEGQMDVCQLETLSYSRSFKIEKSHLTALAESPDCRHLAMGTQEGIVHIYEFSELTRAVPSGLQLTRARSYLDLEQVREEFRSSLQRAMSAYERADYKHAYLDLLEARSVTGYNRDPEAMELTGRLIEHLRRRVLEGVWEQRNLTDPGNLPTTQVVWAGEQAILTASGKFLRYWDLQRGSCTRGFVGHSDPVCSVEINPEHRLVLSCGKGVRLWHLDTGECMQRLSPPSAHGVLWATLHPDAMQLCILGRLGDLTWMQRDSTILKTQDMSGVNLVHCTADWRTALFGGAPGKPALSCWNLLTQKKLFDESRFRVKRGEANLVLQVTALQVAPMGRFALTAGLDLKVRLWDLSDGRCLRIMEGHEDTVHNLRFSRDARTGVSVGKDGAVCLWDLGTGMLLKKLMGPWGEVFAVDISPDARFLVTASADNSVRLWELDWELDPERRNRPLSVDYPRKTILQRIIGVMKMVPKALE